ncbi:MAG TPA: PIN domain-containing protein [Armatimonadota bacterium]|nr:PIN domain-containing protein [Armatimonadota bacterium]HOS43050.1 PIN domain-containing protein [Armatimonadota bacterium]
MTDLFDGVSRLFLDSAPLIYFVERHPSYFPRLVSCFTAIAQGQFIGVTSPITLAECMVGPERLQSTYLQRAFAEAILHADNVHFQRIHEKEARLAAKIRVRYRLLMPDALQIATAINTQCDAFLTNDLDLRRVTELRILTVAQLPR